MPHSASARQPRGELNPPFPKIDNQGRAGQGGFCHKDMPLDAGPDTGSLGWSFEAVT